MPKLETLEQAVTEAQRWRSIAVERGRTISRLEKQLSALNALAIRMCQRFSELSEALKAAK